MRRNLIALFSLLAMLANGMHVYAACSAGNANPAVAESTPTSDFIENGDGTVTHAKTGLMWKWCAEGLNAIDPTCATGTISALDWAGALAASTIANTAGYADWRVPNKKELESLVELCGFNPALNQNVFPATPNNNFFWSASTNLANTAEAWMVTSGDGGTGTDLKSAVHYVRLVRSGRPADSYDRLKTTQTIAFGAQGGKTFGAASFALSPVASASSGLAVSYTSTTGSVCTIADTTVTIVAAGTCTIAADQAGNVTYNAAPQVTQNIAIGKASQAITFGAQAGKTFGAPPFALSPTATASSGLAVSYSSLTTSVCTIADTTVTIVALGTCTIAANQAGNGNYNSAPQVTQNITISAAANAPTATTTAASNISANGATLNGNVSANGATTNVTFDYGTSTAYGTNAAATPATLSAGAGSAVALTIAGLSCNTIYHFRVKGVNSAGTTNGSDQSFTTSACVGTVPGAPTILAATPGAGRATVSFTAPVSNGGSPITSYIATCVASGKITRTASGAGSPITVWGLTGGVQYSCSVAASNSVGTGASSGALPVTARVAKNLISAIMLLLN